MNSEIIKGTVTRITYYSESDGYSVLQVMPENDLHAKNTDGTLTVTGNMPQSLDPGHVLAVEGYWWENPKYGEQFKALGVNIIEKRAIPAAAATGDNYSAARRPAMLPGIADSDSLRGTVERITFYNEDSGWGVLRIEPMDDDFPDDALSYDNLVTVVGIILPMLNEGEAAEFAGSWVTNEQYGKQFKATQIVPMSPASPQGVIRYIADTVDGIGPVNAGRIVDHFGKETLNILDQNPERIHEVPELKSNLAENFIQTWQQNRTERRIMVELQGWGITNHLAKKIYDQYDINTLTILKDDPYQLADDLHGIGFQKADAIASAMGIPHDAPQRLRAGLVYTLTQMSNDGHTYAPRDVLVNEATALLGVQDSDIDLNAEIETQQHANKLKVDVLHMDGEKIEAVYLPAYYYSEVNAAKMLHLLATSPSKIIWHMKPVEWDDYLAELAEQNQVSLSPQQQSAVKAALTSKVSVLTGGPGTGKTTTLRMVINALDQEKFSYMLASPTGRAAKRLQEATGRDASTIHRMLRWDALEGRFEHDAEHPLETDMLIVDEASMIDLWLLDKLLQALRPATHLMLVGDVDQLPSVGAGNVLNDIISSDVAFVTRLTQIFRQEDASHIVTNAHRINHGQMPIMDNESRDFFFFNLEDPAEAGEMVVDIVAQRLEKKIADYDRFNDVQVIAPMYRGPIGVNALNEALQARLNPQSPGKAEKKFGGRIFRKDDKVMQTKNNYEKEVFNGDIGTLYAIDDDENTITVDMDGRLVNYDYDDADEQLIHAYCISTHRSQGSEYPIVVMPVMTQHYIMLQRNLLYTAITRARRMVVLVGTHRAVAIAVKNNQVSERYSGLLARLT